MPNDLNLSLLTFFHDGGGRPFGFPGHVPPPEKVPESYRGLWRQRITDHVIITSGKMMPFVGPYLEGHRWTVVVSETDFPGRSCARTPQEALELARGLAEYLDPGSEMFVVVGERLREHFLPVVSRLYVMNICSRPGEPAGVSREMLDLLSAGPFFHHERLIAEPLNGWMARVDLYAPDHRRPENRISA